MLREKMLHRSMRLMFSGTVIVGMAAFAQPVLAQEKADVGEIVATGRQGADVGGVGFRAEGAVDAG